MILFLALFTVTPNLGRTFRLGKNPTSLTLIRDHCVESYYTPGIYAKGYIVFVCSFVRSYFLLSRGICVKVLR